MNEIDNLYSKDDKLAYDTLLYLEQMSANSNELYAHFDELLDMLKNDKSFVRVRGFRLICAISKWDVENKINKNIELILNELDDDKGTSIRQCLGKINLLLMYKNELSDIIKNKLNGINLSKYKESMQSLIQKDIEKIFLNNF